MKSSRTFSIEDGPGATFVDKYNDLKEQFSSALIDSKDKT